MSRRSRSPARRSTASAVAEPFAQGAWFRTPPVTSAVRCKEYTAPPPPAGRGGIRIYTIPPNVYIGPVHNSTTEGRIHGDTMYSVLVPSQIDSEMLVWVNVKRATQWFAREVPQHILQNWRRRGWVNMLQPIPMSATTWKISRQGPT